MCFLEVWCYFEQVRRLMSESRVQVQTEMIDLDLYTFYLIYQRTKVEMLSQSLNVRRCPFENWFQKNSHQKYMYSV